MTSPSPFSDRRLMSLSAQEFAASLSKLGSYRNVCGGHAVIDLAPEGTVEIRFEPGAPKTLGGLLALPQATVTLTFTGASAQARDDFVRRFDIAFQRGGG